MKILLTGATGYVGRHLLESWKNNQWDIHAISRNALAIKNLIDADVQLYNINICNEKEINNLLAEIKPEIIVHTAANSKPNECEIEQEASYLNNVIATRYLADFAKENNSYLIFLSTDFVFNDGGFYKEDDVYCPVNYYGKSKQLAEEAIIESACRNSIIRVVLVYGKVLAEQRSTFLQWVQANLIDEKKMDIYTDQLRTPCYVNDLCWAINKLIKIQKQGIFHICGNEVFTPYSLATVIADYLKLNTDLINPITGEQKSELAKRPANATLCIEKAISEIGFKVTKLQDAFKEIF